MRATWTVAWAAATWLATASPATAQNAAPPDASGSATPPAAPPPETPPDAAPLDPAPQMPTVDEPAPAAPRAADVPARDTTRTVAAEVPRSVASSPVASSQRSAEAAPARHRIVVILRQDVAWIAGDDPCTAASQGNGDFSCFRNTGSQYLGTPDPRRELTFQGWNAATTRLLAGYERFFGEHVALTGSFGVVLQGGGPTPVGADAHAFLPIHLELDGAYWPWGATGHAARVRPFALVGGGLAQIDSSFTLTVHEDPDAAPAAAQLDNPAQQELEVVSKRGTGFIDAGLGIEALVSGPLTVRGRVLGLWSFPRPGTNVAFDLGFGVDL